MEDWQKVLIAIYGFVNLAAFIKGYKECKEKSNSFGLANYFNIFGIFVWGDAIVIGLFWTLIAVVSIILDDWYLFLLVLSVFWTVRGFGEMTYWLNQQFGKPEKNPPYTLRFYSIFKTDSIWFIYQVIWQCITVVSIIFTIYFSYIWLR